jgi:hypothetical protein
MVKILLQLLFVLLSFSLSAQCDGRYTQKLFKQVEVTYNIEYGRNTNSRGIAQPLGFDIYQPIDDTASLRAVLVMMHGGAYWVGKKNHAECTLIGQDLGRMGYVVISPDYRRENSPIALLSEELMIKAVGRGLQDTKAMIRYLYKSAQEGNPYRIDTNKIFVGGASAGAINALHASYLDTADYIQPQWKQWLNEIGGLEGTTGNAGYSTNAAGIISISGALGDIKWMYNNNIPIAIIHNTRDPQIAYYYGQPYGIVLLPNLYGGSYIHKTADSLGIYNTFYSMPTEDHTAYEENGHRKQPYYDSTVFYMTKFMSKIIGCNHISTPIIDNQYQESEIFTNSISIDGSFKLSSAFFGSNIYIYDISLKKIWQQNNFNSLYIQPHLSKGNYIAIAYLQGQAYKQKLFVR